MPDRAAIVTGGTRGIGRAIAEGLLQDGYRVTITGRRPEGVQAAVEAFGAAGHEVLGVAHNMAADDAPAAILAQHLDRHGRLDVLVNNAGIGIGAAADAHQTKHTQMMLDINVRSIVLFYREAIPALKQAATERGQAHVINLASAAGLSPQPWLSVYSATKAAVIAYSEAMARELAPHRIKSTALAPGFVDTDMAEFVRGQIPPDQMIQTSDLVAAMRFVLSLSPGCTVPQVMMIRPSETGVAGLGLGG